MVNASRIKKHRPLGHLGRFGMALGESQLVVIVIAPWNDASCAIFRGEIRHRPYSIALNLVAPRERKEIERPLIAMNRLRRLSCADRNDLRQMQLDAGGMTEQLADSAEHRRMHHEIAARFRSRD